MLYSFCSIIAVVLKCIYRYIVSPVHFVYRLLDAGAPPNGLEGSSLVPMLAALQSKSLGVTNKLEVILMLLDKGANWRHLTYMVPNEAMTALHVATQISLSTG